jgi:nitrogen-specific signal transduction histidine kinase
LKEALGMQLINTLTQQLQGIIQFDNKEEETSFSLLFERDDSLTGAANAYMQ